MRTRLSFDYLEARVVLSTYYIGTGGNNNNDGSSGSPWRTLQHAADTVGPGDLVIVRAGNYAGMDMWTDGTAAGPITFRGETGAVINAANERTPDGLNLEGADYIVIEGFQCNGLPRSGIRSVLNSHVTIRNNNCDSNGRWGIFTGHSYDLLIENNVGSRSTLEHGIYVSNSGDRPVIRSNVCFSNCANGIHMNGDESQGGDGIISDALVERNTLYDNGLGGGSAINCDGVQNSRIQNNLIYNTHASGISLYKIDGGDGSKNNIVVNNTVIVSSTGRWGLNIRDGSTGNQVFNNIFYSNQSFRGAISCDADCLPGFVSDYNAVEDRFTTDDGDSVMTLAQWRTATGQDAHSFITTLSGLFVDMVNNDYHLSATSPAIDAGTSQQAPNADRDGLPRPRGVTYDIGAYEYDAAPPADNGTVGLEDDPWNPGQQALVARGTAGDDVIKFNLSADRLSIVVTMNNVNRGTFALTQFIRIRGFGLGGADQLIVHTSIVNDCELVGGDGNDLLRSGKGRDLLRGEAGDDQLFGRDGKDLLIGGVGADILTAANHSDLLIASRTTHESDDLALKAIMGEWTSSRSYTDRCTRLAGGVGGLPRLDATTVLDDAAIDRLLGGAQADWFFANLLQDTTDKASNERVN